MNAHRCHQSSLYKHNEGAYGQKGGSLILSKNQRRIKTCERMLILAKASYRFPYFPELVWDELRKADAAPAIACGLSRPVTPGFCLPLG